MKAKQRNTLKLVVTLSQTSSSNCILTPDILLRQSQLLRARSHAGSNCFFWLSSLYCSLLKRLYSQYALSQLRFHSMLFWVQILQACLIWGSPFADPTQYSGHSLLQGWPPVPPKPGSQPGGSEPRPVMPRMRCWRDTSATAKCSQTTQPGHCCETIKTRVAP